MPIYFYGGPDLWIYIFSYPLGANYSLIDSFDASGCSSDFWPFNSGQFGWGTKYFGYYNDDVLDEGENYANPPGYHSLAFFGYSQFADIAYLHAEDIIQILTFRLHAADSDSLAGQSFSNALQMGFESLTGPAWVRDLYNFPETVLVNARYATVHFNDGFICGTVTNAYGAPIQNASLEILDTPFNEFTDADGEYCLPALRSGSYDIAISHPDYCDTVIANVTVIEGDTTELNVILGNSSISGAVTDTLMNPLANILVEISGTDLADTADATGYYSFHGLCPGHYHLLLTRPGYCELDVGNIILGTDDTLIVNVVLRYGSTISGTIYNSEHVPLPGAIIEIVDMFYADTSGIDGHYQLGNLCAGTYDLLVTLPGYCSMEVHNISVGENTTRTLNIDFDNGGVLTGNITDSDGLPLSGVVISVEGTAATGTSGTNGDYYIAGICPGEYDVTFTKDGFWKSPVEDVAFSHNYPTNLDMTMCDELPDVPDTAIFWAGGNFDNCEWYDTISVQPGEWLNIPIYFRAGSNLWAGEIVYSLAARYGIIDRFDSTNSSFDFWPFNEGLGWFGRFWDYKGDNDYSPNPQGYHSLTFSGSYNVWPFIWLHSEVPIKILNFRVHISDTLTTTDSILTDVFIEGAPNEGYGPYPALGDTLGGSGFAFDLVINTHFPVLKITAANSPYLLGDVNMYNATWPPAVIGSDVTYLVNFFRGISTSHACLLDGFWGSADVNGDCRVVGSDVTRLVSYFRGQAVLQACPDHLPLWETPQGVPQEAPPVWPGCE